MTRFTTSMLLAATASLPLSQAANAETLLFDFGRTDLQTNPGWNNVFPATSIPFAPLAINTNITAHGFELTDPLLITREPSPLAS